MRFVPLVFADRRVFTGSFIWFCFGGLPTARFLAVLLSKKTSVTFSLTGTIGLDIPTKTWAVVTYGQKIINVQLFYVLNTGFKVKSIISTVNYINY